MRRPGSATPRTSPRWRTSRVSLVSLSTDAPAMSVPLRTVSLQLPNPGATISSRRGYSASVQLPPSRQAAAGDSSNQSGSKPLTYSPIPPVYTPDFCLRWSTLLLKAQTRVCAETAPIGAQSELRANQTKSQVSSRNASFWLLAPVLSPTRSLLILAVFSKRSWLCPPCRGVQV